MDDACSSEDRSTMNNTASMIHATFNRECRNSACFSNVHSKERCSHIPEDDIVKHAVTCESGPPLKKARYESFQKASENRGQWKTVGENLRLNPDRQMGLTTVQLGQDQVPTVSCDEMTLSSHGHLNAGQRDKCSSSTCSDAMHFPWERSCAKDTSPRHSAAPSESTILRHSSDPHRDTVSSPPKHATLYPIIGRQISDSSTDSEDDRMDASNLVLSVIKTKVDIQTMKMCLRHNADAFSSRNVSGPMSVPSIQSAMSPSNSTLQPDLSEHSLSIPKAREEPVAGPSGHSGQYEEQREHHQGHSICSCNCTDCQTCRRLRQAPHGHDLSPEDVPSVPVGICVGHLEHWQDQHTAKAIVDNAINRTIEEMVVAPDQPSQAPEVSFDQEGEASGRLGQSVIGRIQQPIQTLQERLEPVISQLTQASELVFARNIEHSRFTSVSDGNDDISPADGSVDHR